MVLISACLAGKCCRYNQTCAKENLPDELHLSKEECILVCPELLGGLFTPRDPAELVGGTAKDVIAGRAKVLTKAGEDVTQAFLKGAYATLALAKENHITVAYLKARSPSCGVGKIYDGTFTGKLIEGNGLTAELLKDEGIRIISK